MANRIEAWAKAIQKHEGYFPGSASYRNNNPGNFRCSSLVMGEFGATKCVNNLAVFPTYEKGFAALKQFLIYACTDQLRSYKKEMTLIEFYSVYAPSSDGNNPKNYASAIAKDMGVSIDTKIKDFYDVATPPVQKIFIENQLDPKWKKWYIGKVKTSSFEKFGCFLFCLSYLYSLKLGRQVPPSEVDAIFVKQGVYSGDLIISEKAAKALGLEYLGKETNINKPPAWHPTIKEVDHSIQAGKQQHFVVRTKVNGVNVILDTLEGVQRAINYYEKKTNAPNWESGHFSYRLFK